MQVGEREIWYDNNLKLPFINIQTAAFQELRFQESQAKFQMSTPPPQSLPTCGADILAGDDEIVEIDSIGWILRPTIGHVGFEGEGIGF